MPDGGARVHKPALFRGGVGRLHLSQVVRTEMTQLLPSRHLNLRLGADKALVRVERRGPDGTPNMIETWVD
jgi:hypothetical protein